MEALSMYLELSVLEVKTTAEEKVSVFNINYLVAEGKETEKCRVVKYENFHFWYSRHKDSNHIFRTGMGPRPPVERHPANLSVITTISIRNLIAVPELRFLTVRFWTRNINN
jgi:hypothetical protein